MPLWGGPAPIYHRLRSRNVGAVVLLQLVPPTLEDVVTHVRLREIGVFIIEVDIRSHALSYSHHNESFDHCFLLSSDPLFFGIVSLPFHREEVHETTQSLMLSLALSFLLAALAQPIDVCCDTCISYGFYGPGHYVVHLEVLSQ